MIEIIFSNNLPSWVNIRFISLEGSLLKLKITDLDKDPSEVLIRKKDVSDSPKTAILVSWLFKAKLSGEGVLNNIIDFLLIF